MRIRFVDKVKLDLAVSKRDLPDVLETIRAQACTGKVGDGKIFVLDVRNIMRIRTGERGMSAL